MKKILSLVRVSMTEDMNLFKLNIKKQNRFTRVMIPIVLTILLMSVTYSYSEIIIKELIPIHMEYVLISLFIFIVSIMTLVEGIYKSSSLLFNCRDDNLLFSLPLERNIILFIRVFKFYLFELMYNSVFLVPVLFVYARYVHPSIIYYVVSLIGLLLFPIIPILLSCLMGMFSFFFSSFFKGKNFVQTGITFIFLIGVMYLSYYSNGIGINIANHATSIHDFIVKFYYPSYVFIHLISHFEVLKLFEFILVHVILFIVVIALIGRFYFRVNSFGKGVRVSKVHKDYKIRSSSFTSSFIKKDFNRFINSTVFVTNAAFGLVLFLLGCILFALKFDDVVNMIIGYDTNLTIQDVYDYMPVILFMFICFASFMTSITSSMISLEGRAINLLKSLPVKVISIVRAKVLMAVLVMIPFILIGDVIFFIRFSFDFISIVLILIGSCLIPCLAETIGIIVNLKYPKVDFKNDTEVVKQSMSSMIAVFLGMILVGISLYFGIKAISCGFSSYLILLIFISFFMVIYVILFIILNNVSQKYFDNISI